MNTIIKQNDKPILSLSAPIRKVALWHVTKRCNMECKYCYGSFDGSSYKKNYFKEDLNLDNMLDVVGFLSESGINRIHLCGGEPFLYEGFYELLKSIRQNKIESFVLTNLTFLPDYVEKLFSENLITNLSFSLDSLNKDYNLYVRGVHSTVLENINKILNYKKTYNSNIELGLYVVVTKKNMDFLLPLIDWAVKMGLDYITLQAVYLPKSHKYYNDLSLTAKESESLEKVFDYLVSSHNQIRISGTLLRFITKALINKNNLSVENCFVEQNSQYYFIDGSGNIKNCTTKNNIIGCSKDRKFPKSICNPSNNICKDFCLDCIGIWEMVYPEEFNDKLIHVL